MQKRNSRAVDIVHVKNLLLKSAIAVSTCVVLVANVSASEALAKKNACMACHAMDDKVVGPSFKEVAKKYASAKDGEATIATTIRKGSVDKWGKVPMPANEQLSEADAKALAAWILAAGK
jgi:cytochrome c